MPAIWTIRGTNEPTTTNEEPNHRRADGAALLLRGACVARPRRRRHARIVSLAAPVRTFLSERRAVARLCLSLRNRVARGAGMVLCVGRCDVSAFGSQRRCSSKLRLVQPGARCCERLGAVLLRSVMRWWLLELEAPAVTISH